MPRTAKPVLLSALFRDKGLEISEPMIFGIGSGIFFGHLPFVKMVGLPITTYRHSRGRFSARRPKGWAGNLSHSVFAMPQKGMDEMRRVLQTGQIVGLTTNIYWLSYFPNRFRFQFNGHNIIILREIENGFRVSDPVLDKPVDCPTEDLDQGAFRARAAGAARVHVLSRCPLIFILICAEPASRECRIPAI